MNELRTYAKAGQIAQEVFSSLRTVLSLNGGKSEQQTVNKSIKIVYLQNIITKHVSVVVFCCI